MHERDQLSYREIAVIERLSHASVRGRIGRARRARAAFQQQAAIPSPAQPQVNAPLSPATLLALYASLNRPAPPDLRNDTEHDRDDWHTIERKLSGMKRLAKVMLLGDIHFPDHDSTALKLAAEIALWLTPDVIVLNGDTFDFTELSSFAQHWKQSRQDAFQAIRKPYYEFIDLLRSYCPNAAILHLDGNHNSRLYRYLAEHSQFAETIAMDYRALVRHGGVLYMGELQELDLGHMLIQHGRKVGLNAAKKAMEDLGMYSQVQSHTHVPEIVYRRVKRKHGSAVVMSTVTPCLCKINPAYHAHETRQSRWIQGVTVVHVDMQGNELVNAQNVIFHPRAGSRLTALCGKQYWEAG